MRMQSRNSRACIAPVRHTLPSRPTVSGGSTTTPDSLRTSPSRIAACSATIVSSSSNCKMPSSRPNIIPTVIHIVKQLRPASILDVGVGFGKWGHLFREYTDIVAAEHDPRRYQRKHWQIRIDGIEGHAAYLTPMHRFLYNEIFIGDARQIVRNIPGYDLIFLGDIIEHFEKADGLSLLRRCVAKAKKAVVLSTPKHETLQEDLCGNELERHRSLWNANDFKEFA